MTAPPLDLALPKIGLGVWQLEGDEATRLVQHAVEAGYDLIDTAAAYDNEEAVGRGLRAARRPREDVIVTTKIWLSDFDRVPEAVDESRRRLGDDTLDLVLLHWPVPSRFPRTLGAYDALLRMQERGRVARVGVSNFTPAHLDALYAHTGVRPLVNQIELHPFFAQTDARRVHASLGIATQAYSPLGGPIASRGRPIEHPTVSRIAHELGADPAQVVLAWHRHHGVAAVPRSRSAERIVTNLASLSIALEPDQLERLDALDAGTRISHDPEVVHDDTFA